MGWGLSVGGAGLPLTAVTRASLNYRFTAIHKENAFRAYFVFRPALVRPGEGLGLCRYAIDAGSLFLLGRVRGYPSFCGVRLAGFCLSSAMRVVAPYSLSGRRTASVPNPDCVVWGAPRYHAAYANYKGRSSRPRRYLYCFWATRLLGVVSGLTLPRVFVFRADTTFPAAPGLNLFF